MTYDLEKVIQKIYPLSKGQKELLDYQVANPQCAAYNIPIALGLQDYHDHDTVCQVINQLLIECPALNIKISRDLVSRVHFQEIQYRNSFKEVFFKKVQTENLESVIHEFQVRPFDLFKDVMRVVVLYTTCKQKYLLLICHQIVLDNSSVGLLQKRLTDLLKLFDKHSTANTAFDNYEYVDLSFFNSINKNLLKDCDATRMDLEYWTNRLGHPRSRINMNYSFFISSNRGLSFSSDEIKMRISKHNVARMRQVANQLNVDVESYLLAVFNILLFRLSNVEDLILQIPIITRVASSDIGIGYFNNVLLFRSQIQEDRSFADFVNSVFDHLKKDRTCLTTGYSRALSELGINCTDTKVDFPIEFKYNGPQEQMNVKTDSGGAPLIDIERNNRYSYSIELKTVQDFIQVKLCFDSNVYSRESIKHNLRYFLHILEETLNDPCVKISKVELLTKKEISQALSEYGRSSIVPVSNLCLHDIIVSKSEQYLDKWALEYDNRKLSYSDLMMMSKKIALNLQDIGVRPETLVGIYMSPSIEMIVTILGVLRSGGAYVPIDPKYPKERCAYILEDSIVQGNKCKSSRLILTDESYLERLTLIVETMDIDLLSISDVLNRSSADSFNDLLENNVSSHNLAYVIYTSGSTGDPKGVMVEHKNVTSLLASGERIFDFSKDDVWTLFHSFCFDFSVWEIFGCLSTGGKLLIVPYKLSRSPRKFLEVINNKQVSVLNQTPLAFYQLIDISKDVILPSLKYVILGGAALNPERLKLWKKSNYATTCVNMYGITETTVHVTSIEMLEEEHMTSSKSIIGQALPTLDVYIVSKYGSLLPVGVAGEIYVGGAGVARGYLNQNALTNSKFVHNPFGEGMVYKSGDLAKRLCDGTLEYLGRIDDQVKIRGHRIEIGEIETKIRAHEYIHDAVVIVREYAGKKKLSMHCVLTIENILCESDIRTYLNEKLPHFMIPSFISIIDKIPLTINGKIEAKELLAEIETRTTERLFQPRTRVEIELVQIWKKLFETNRINLNDDFFLLGGDAQLIPKLQAEIYMKFDVIITNDEVLEYSKLKELSFQIETLLILSQRNEESLQIIDMPIMSNYANQIRKASGAK